MKMDCTYYYCAESSRLYLLFYFIHVNSMDENVSTMLEMYRAIRIRLTDVSRIHFLPLLLAPRHADFKFANPLRRLNKDCVNETGSWQRNAEPPEPARGQQCRIIHNKDKLWGPEQVKWIVTAYSQGVSNNSMFSFCMLQAKRVLTITRRVKIVVIRLL